MYRLVAAARAAYQQGVKLVAAQAGTALKPLKLGTVGRAHAAWSEKQTPKNGLPIFLDAIVFYRGSYLVQFVGGCQQLNDTAELLKLARIIDARIQHAQ